MNRPCQATHGTVARGAADFPAVLQRSSAGWSPRISWVNPECFSDGVKPSREPSAPGSSRNIPSTNGAGDASLRQISESLPAFLRAVTPRVAQIGAHDLSRRIWPSAAPPKRKNPPSRAAAMARKRGAPGNGGSSHPTGFSAARSSAKAPLACHLLAGLFRPAHHDDRAAHECATRAGERDG